MTALSNAEEKFPLEVGALDSIKRETMLTSATALGYWVLFGGQDQGARRKV